jgi:hypothetical protein
MTQRIEGSRSLLAVVLRYLLGEQRTVRPQNAADRLQTMLNQRGSACHTALVFRSCSS